MQPIRFTPRLVIGSILCLIPVVTFVIGMGYAVMTLVPVVYQARKLDNRVWDLGTSPSVSVDLFDGPITVAQSKDGRVAVALNERATTATSQAAADAALAAIRVAEVREGNTLRLEVTTTANPPVARARVTVELRVPPDANVDLITRGSRGDIDIGKVFEGPYQTSLRDAPVALRAATARALGPTYRGITALLAPRPSQPPTTLDLASQQASVLIQGDDVLIHAAAEDGLVQFTGRLAPGVHQIRTGRQTSTVHEVGRETNQIRLNLPEGCVFEVTAESETGAVTSDFDPTGATRPNPHRLTSPPGLDAPIRLEIHTVDGPIEIRRASARGRQ